MPRKRLLVYALSMGAVIFLATLLMALPQPGALAQGGSTPRVRPTVTPSTPIQAPASYDLAVDRFEILAPGAQVDRSLRPEVKPGEPFKVRFQVSNKGPGKSPAASARVTFEYEGMTLFTSTKDLGELPAGSQSTHEVDVTLQKPPGAAAKPSPRGEMKVVLIPRGDRGAKDNNGTNNTAKKECALVLPPGSVTALGPQPEPPDRPRAGTEGPGPIISGLKLVKTDLEIQRQSKEFESWGNEVEVSSPSIVTLRWKARNVETSMGQWELAASPFPDRVVIKPLGTGWSKTPAEGQVSQFAIDLGKYLPKEAPLKGKDYYVRIVPAVEAVGGDVQYKPAPSNVVKIRYVRPPAGHTQWTPEDLPEYVSVVEGKMDLHLDTLSVGNPEDSGGDEPYLIAVVIIADGTTIDLDNPEKATARVLYSKGTHGNLGAQNVPQGKSLPIPASVGTFQADIKPIALPSDVYALMGLKMIPTSVKDKLKSTRPAVIALLVVAAEEDASSDDTAQAAYQAMVNGLGPKLNQGLQSRLPQIVYDLKTQAIQKKGLSESELTAFLQQQLLPMVDEIQSAVQKEVEDAAESSVLSKWWNVVFLPVSPEVVDPDDQIGCACKIWPLNLNPTGVAQFEPINMSFNCETAGYSLAGWLKVTAVSKPVQVKNP
jgi:hypothetical protein